MNGAHLHNTQAILVRPPSSITELGLNRFWWTLKSPAPLAGMAYPDGIDWPMLAGYGFGCVIRLARGRAYDARPLEVHEFILEDLFGGRQPPHPERETQAIAKAADTVIENLQNGTGVLVHCVGGTGRTGTVIGSSLRRLGMGASEIVDWLRTLHIARGRSGWPESDWQRIIIERPLP